MTQEFEATEMRTYSNRTDMRLNTPELHGAIATQQMIKINAVFGKICEIKLQFSEGANIQGKLNEDGYELSSFGKPRKVFYIALEDFDKVISQDENFISWTFDRKYIKETNGNKRVHKLVMGMYDTREPNIAVHHLNTNKFMNSHKNLVKVHRGLHTPALKNGTIHHLIEKIKGHLKPLVEKELKEKFTLRHRNKPNPEFYVNEEYRLLDIRVILENELIKRIDENVIAKMSNDCFDNHLTDEGNKAKLTEYVSKLLRYFYDLTDLITLESYLSNLPLDNFIKQIGAEVQQEIL